MQYIDIHTHTNLAAFFDDRSETIHRALEAGVQFINVGTELSSSKEAVALLKKHKVSVYATVGLHPTHTSASFHDENETKERGELEEQGEVFDYDTYKELASNSGVVAIGECGLDFQHETTDEGKKKQIEVFEAQIALANELQKPLMLHLRSGKDGNAYQEAQTILKSQAKVLGDSHFFAGSLEDARGFWDMGYSTSFTGVITFTHDYDEVVKAAPKELIHAETDAPYVAPVPFRGRRNEPAYVVEVVKKMAEIRGVSLETQAAQLIKNAKSLFAISA